MFKFYFKCGYDICSITISSHSLFQAINKLALIIGEHDTIHCVSDVKQIKSI